MEIHICKFIDGNITIGSIISLKMSFLMLMLFMMTRNQIYLARGYLQTAGPETPYAGLVVMFACTDKGSLSSSVLSDAVLISQVFI